MIIRSWARVVLRNCVFASVWMLTVPVFAAQMDEGRFRSLLGELRCLVCQNQSLEDSSAALAGDLRNLVRQRMAAGDSDEQIVEFLVARYGAYVHYRPPLTAATALLWFGPFLLLAAVTVLIFLARRRASIDNVDDQQMARARALLERDE